MGCFRKPGGRFSGTTFCVVGTIHSGVHHGERWSGLAKTFGLKECFWVPRGIVCSVLSAGYTINLDDSALYLAQVSVSVVHVAETMAGVYFLGGAANIDGATAHVQSRDRRAARIVCGFGGGALETEFGENKELEHFAKTAYTRRSEAADA